MPTDDELIDNPLKDYKTPEETLGDNGLLKQLTKAVIERAMQAKLTEQLSYEHHDTAGDNSDDSRNGTSLKTSRAAQASGLLACRVTATPGSTRRSF